MKRYRVVAEDNGQEIIVVEIESRIAAGTFDDPGATIPGLKSIRRENTGGAMNLLSDGRLQEVASGRIFHL